MKEKILLFGGSFDPIHNGHIAIAKNVKATIKADRVIFIPAKNPRWKRKVTSSLDRLEMLKIALEEDDAFSICDFEIKSRERINYSIDTIRYLVSLYPKSELYFLIGFDQLLRLNEWKDIDEIVQLVQVVAYCRPNISLSTKNQERYGVKIIYGDVYDISSTMIRNLKSVEVPLKVMEYIHNHNLYYLDSLLKRLSSHRYEHSKSVALLSLKIALNNDLDGFKCYTAGLLHDLGKEVDEKVEEEIMNEHFKSFISLPKFSYHQFVGSYLANSELGITDDDILDGIKYHATGKRNMSPIGEVVYASDKIEPLRGFDSSELIASCIEDYHQGFKNVLEANIIYLKEHNKNIDNFLTNECIEYYIENKK